MFSEESNQKRISLFLILILLFIGISFAPKSVEAQTTTICSNQSVPAGYVITAITNNGSCGTLYATYTVFKPPFGTSVVNVCSISPIPIGFVVTSINTSSICSGANIYQLTYVLGMAGQVLVCYVSPIPALWAIVAATPPFSACQGEAGYYIQYYYSHATMDVCSVTPALQNRVVVSSSNNLPCGGAATWTYATVSDYIAVCPFSPIPFGWTSIGGVAVSNCSGESPGYLLVKGSDMPGIFASPNPVPWTPRPPATVNISWNAPGATSVDVYVNINGTRTFWMTGGALGSATYGNPNPAFGIGISQHNTYTFQLYRAGTTSPLLSSISVSMAAGGL